MRRRLFRQLSRWGRWPSSPPRARSSRARSARRRVTTTSASSTRGRGCSPPTAPSTSRACGTASSTRPAARQGQRQEDHPLAGRRQDRSLDRRLGDEGLHRPGLQDHRRRHVLGRRAPGGADRGAEPGAVHLRPGSLGCDHRRSTATRSAPAGRPTRTSPRRRPTCRRARARTCLVFAQDSAFGQGNFAAVKAIIGGKGHNVSSLYVPLSATDFTPFAQQAKQAKPTSSTSPGPARPPRRSGRRSTSRASSRRSTTS